MSRTLSGLIRTRIVSVRFAFSGKVSSVAKSAGDEVKKGNLIASLDRRILQMQLDKELADFEKARADFEAYAQKAPEIQTDLEKYLKTAKQATLNASVKQVELAKAQLDQCDLFSPVNGTILDDSSIIPGIYVTPAGSEIKIIDSSSFYFEAEIDEKDIKELKNVKEAVVQIPTLEISVESKNASVIADGKKFYFRIPVEGEGMFIGLSAEAKL